MDSWADDEFSPMPVHGKERRNADVRQEEGASFEGKKKESFKGWVLDLHGGGLSWIAHGGQPWVRLRDIRP